MSDYKFAYLYRMDIENPGDINSTIMRYFTNNLHGLMIDVSVPDIPKMKVDTLFIGGGAIFTTEVFINNINTILKNVEAKHKIVWGAGVLKDLIPKEIKKYDLFGTRDVLKGFEWVPCPSVMHDSFVKFIDKPRKKGMLILNHWKRPIDIGIDCTIIKNKPNVMDEVLEAISDHTYVLTSSYHAAYWATLLKRKVILIGENLPAKFDNMKHYPVIAKTFSKDLLQKAKVWEDAYFESIVANNNFRKKVENLIEIPLTFRNPMFMEYSQ